MSSCSSFFAILFFFTLRAAVPAPAVAFVRSLHPAAARSRAVSTPSIPHLSWFSLHNSSTVASSARAIRIARYTLGALSPRSIAPSVLWLHPTFCASQR
nr:MAG TPA: hypothetical protein [Caudoviricetes sp.]